MSYIDKVGQDLTKPYPPLDICEWEEMQVEGEIAGFGAIKDLDDARKEMEKLGGYICKMSMEIFRLRLTYGEEVWQSVYHTKEEDDLIRKVHEAERWKYKVGTIK